MRHYAYLSQRYSEIAGEHAKLALNQERQAKLDLERQRLQLALREAKLASVQQQGKWVEAQLPRWPRASRPRPGNDLG